MRLLWNKTTTKVFGDAHVHNEDVFLPKGKGGESIHRFVMCDGATSSYAARKWAQMLATAFAADSGESVKERVYSAAKAYEANYPATALAGLDHCTIEAFKRGSSATLLLLEQEEDGGSINVTAVGDTCIFLFDEHCLITDSFPLSDEAQFSTSAYLITVTFEGLKSLFSEKTRDLYWKHKTFSAADIGSTKILCATDAVAQWVAANRNRPRDIERLIKAVRSCNKKKFAGFIEYERSQRRMATDDSTVAILEM